MATLNLRYCPAIVRGFFISRYLAVTKNLANLWLSLGSFWIHLSDRRRAWFPNTTPSPPSLAVSQGSAMLKPKALLSACLIVYVGLYLIAIW